MRIKSKLGYFNINSMYSYNMYAGFLEGGPTLEWQAKNEHGIPDHAGNIFPAHVPVGSISKIDRTAQLLPHKCNMAWIDDCDRQAVVVWYDDDSEDVKVSLGRELDSTTREEWVKISEQFEF